MPNWRIKSPSGSYWHPELGWTGIDTAMRYSPDGKAFYFADSPLPVGGFWEEIKTLKPKEKPVCSSCGSDDIKTDAYAVWDVEKQDWVLDQAFEKPCTCEKCGSECGLEWVEV